MFNFLDRGEFMKQPMTIARRRKKIIFIAVSEVSRALAVGMARMMRGNDGEIVECRDIEDLLWEFMVRLPEDKAELEECATNMRRFIFLIDKGIPALMKVKKSPLLKVIVLPSIGRSINCN